MYYLRHTFSSLSRKPSMIFNFGTKLNNIPLTCMTFCTVNSSKLSASKWRQNVLTHLTFSSGSRIVPVTNKYHNVRIILYRSFKTSEPKKFHPIFWLVFKPFLKLTAVLSGRGFRKWWKDLPKDKKAYFLNVLRANRNKLLVSCIVTTSLFFGYYISHLEKTPITHRSRFMAFNSQQLEKINEFEFKQVMEKLGPQIIPASHPLTKKVESIVHRILKANEDIKEVHGKQWGVSIIDNSIENAFVLPIGHVFVFTGMLKLCSNDDQLGTILAHEIAHCLQNHGAENVGFTHLLDLISIIIIAAIWAILPSDIISILTHWLYQKSIQLLLELPYNRKIETEADNVGLLLAAKACFDVRESSAFWSKMAILKSTFGSEPQIEFLSTHPSHESRSEYLDSIMDEAIKVRKECGCPTLRYKDPRLDVEGVSKALELARIQFLKQNPKPVIVLST